MVDRLADEEKEKLVGRLEVEIGKSIEQLNQELQNINLTMDKINQSAAAFSKKADFAQPIKFARQLNKETQSVKSTLDAVDKAMSGLKYKATYKDGAMQTFGVTVDLQAQQRMVEQQEKAAQKAYVRAWTQRIKEVEQRTKQEQKLAIRAAQQAEKEKIRIAQQTEKEKLKAAEQAAKEAAKLEMQHAKQAAKEAAQTVREEQKALQQDIDRMYKSRYQKSFEAALGNSASYMGSGDARASVMNKVKNSLIYTTSYYTWRTIQDMVSQAMEVNQQYENGLVNLSRTLDNVTNESLQRYGDAAIQYAKSFGVPLEEVQTAMTELARAGVDDQQALLGMTKSVLTGLNTTEIKSAADMTAYLVSTVRQLNMSYEDSEKIIDSWNKLADKYAVQSNDFAEAIQKAGSASRMLGVDLDTLNAMVVVLGEATQASGDEIGTALKAMEVRLLRPETVKILEDMGIQVKKDADHFLDFHTIMTQVNQKLNEFGENSVQASQLLDALGGVWRKNQIQILAEGWNQIDAVAKESASALGYSVKENEKAMSTFEKQIQIFQQTLNELYISIGQQSGVLDALRLGLQGLTDMTQWFANLSPVAQRYAVILGGVAAAVKLVSVASKGLTGIGVGQWFDIVAAKITKTTTASRAYEAAQRSLSMSQKTLNLSKEDYQLILDSIADKLGMVKSNTASLTAAQKAMDAAQASLRRSTILLNAAMSAGIAILSLAINAAISHVQKQKELASVTAQMIGDIKSNAQQLASLTDEYTSLKDAVTLTSEQKQRLLDLTQQITDLVPSAASVLRDETKSIQEQTEAIWDNYKAQNANKLAQAYNTTMKTMPDIYEKFASQTTYKQVLQQLQQLSDKYQEFGQDAQAAMLQAIEPLRGTDQYTQLLYQIQRPRPLLSDARQNIEEITNFVNSELDKVSNKLVESEANWNQAVANLRDAIMAQYDLMKMPPEVSESFKAFVDQFDTVDDIKKSGEDINQVLNNIAGYADDLGAAYEKLQNNIKYQDIIKQLDEFAKTTNHTDAEIIQFKTDIENQVNALKLTGEASDIAQQKIASYNLTLSQTSVSTQQASINFAALDEQIKNQLDSLDTLGNAYATVIGRQQLSGNVLLDLISKYDTVAVAVSKYGANVLNNGEIIKIVFNAEKQAAIQRLQLQERELQAQANTLQAQLSNWQRYYSSLIQMQVQSASISSLMANGGPSEISGKLDNINKQIESVQARIKAISSINISSYVPKTKIPKTKTPKTSGTKTSTPTYTVEMKAADKYQTALKEINRRLEEQDDLVETTAKKIEMLLAKGDKNSLAEALKLQNTLLDQQKKRIAVLETNYKNTLNLQNQVQAQFQKTFGFNFVGMSQIDIQKRFEQMFPTKTFKSEKDQQAYEDRKALFQQLISNWEDLQNKATDIQNSIYDAQIELYNKTSNQIQEFYDDVADKAMETARHQIAMGRWNTQQQIEFYQKLLKEWKGTVKEQEKLQEELFSLNRKLLEEQLDKVREANKKRIDNIQAAADKEIAIRQKLLDELDEEETAADREESERQHNKKLQELYEELQYHQIRTGKEHLEAIADIQKQIEEENIQWRNQQEKWARQDRRKQLQDEIDDIQQKADEQKKIVEDALQDIENAFNDTNMNIISDAATYQDDWLEMGMKWMQALIDGFNSGNLDGIKNTLDEIIQKTREAMAVIPGISPSEAGQQAAPPAPAPAQPTPTPAPSQPTSPAPAPAKPTAPVQTKYTVKAGDTLSGIAAKYKTTWQKIYEANKKLIGSNPNLIRPGQVLVIPKAHTGALTMSYGIAELKPGELIFPPNLSKQLQTLIGVLSTNSLNKLSGNNQTPAINIDTMFRSENTYLDDELDVDIIGRTLTRAAKNVMRAGGIS